MKKQLLLLLALTIATVNFAAAKNEKPGILTREMRIPPGIKKLVTKGPVDVVLFEDTSTVLSMQGKQKALDALSIEEKDGILSISNNGHGKTVVYVPVRHLEVIEAYGTSRVASSTVLDCPILTLLANDYCRIAVKSSGRIIIPETEDTDLRIEKNIQTLLPAANS